MKPGKITSQLHIMHTHSDVPRYRKQKVVMYRNPKIKINFSYKESKES